MFEKINIVDLSVIIVLGAALILAVFYAMNELAMSIASGLLGYIGGNVKATINRRGDDKNESLH